MSMRDELLGVKIRDAGKPLFDRNKYPFTNDCQKLDIQISNLRNEKDLVYRGEMVGDRRTVKDFLVSKEVQFARQGCSKKLEDESVFGTIQMTQDEFEKLENRIITESNTKRQVLLIGGGVVLLIALAIFIRK